MTAIVAFDFRQRVILLSDLRLIWRMPSGPCYRDDVVKVTRFADNALIGFAGPASGARKTVAFIAERRAELVRSKKHPMITFPHLVSWLKLVSEQELRYEERRNLSLLIASAHLKHDDNTKMRFCFTKCVLKGKRGEVNGYVSSGDRYCVIGFGERVDRLEPFLGKAYEIHQKRRNSVGLALDLSQKFTMISPLEAGISHFFQLFVLTVEGYKHIPYKMVELTGRPEYSSSFLPPNPWGDDPAPTLADVAFVQAISGSNEYFICTEDKGEYTLFNSLTGEKKRLDTLIKDNPEEELGIRFETEVP